MMTSIDYSVPENKKENECFHPFKCISLAPIIQLKRWTEMEVSVCNFQDDSG